ncbi:hypothetical protein MPER_09064 [Moniliophthora perniciosa FA553]|nr:hypothetical protein MPER_09064 [Moniliophthora perniciosa FA553]
MKVADTTKDNGSFDSIGHEEALILFKDLGVDIGSGERGLVKIGKEELKERLRHALWDSQRLDYLFPGKTFHPHKSQKLEVSKPTSWPKWQLAHPELRNSQSMMMMDGFKDAERLDRLVISIAVDVNCSSRYIFSYVFRHFQMSAFTQMENMRGVMMNPPPDMTGAWIGAKSVMGKAALDITREGGKDTPFVAYHTGPSENMLIMEILDVKQIKWPEPSKLQMQLIKSVQETKFGHEPMGDLCLTFHIGGLR